MNNPINSNLTRETRKVAQMTRWVQKIQTLSGTTTYLWSPEIAMRLEAGELGIAEIKAYIAYLESENHCLNRELGKYKRLWQACCRTEVNNSKKVGMPK